MRLIGNKNRVSIVHNSCFFVGNVLEYNLVDGRRYENEENK